MIKRHLLALAFCLGSAWPAHAVSIIAGTGTGGALFAPTTVAAGALFVDSTAITVAVPAGSLVLVGCASASSAQTWSTVGGATDTKSNVYTPALASTNTGTVTVRAYYSVITNALTTSDTIRCTGNSPSATKAIVAAAFSGSSLTPLDAASVAQTGTGTTLTVGPTGTLAYPGGSNGEVLFGFEAYATAGTVTPDPAFVSLGASTTNVRANWGYKIVSASTPITKADVTTVSSAYAGNLAAFIGTGGGVAASCNRALMGVGC